MLRRALHVPQVHGARGEEETLADEPVALRRRLLGFGQRARTRLLLRRADPGHLGQVEPALSRPHVARVDLREFHRPGLGERRRESKRRHR